MNNHPKQRIVRISDDRTVADRVVVAASAAERAKGLLGTASITMGEAIWIEPCNGIHTFGMAFPIDVIILNRDGDVLRVCKNIKPNRILMPTRACKIVIELKPGAVQTHQIQSGDRLTLRKL